MSEAKGSSDTGSTAEKPKHPELLVTSVVSRTQISPTFSRITLSGGTLSKLRHHGYDHWFRMFIARTGHEDTDIPVEPVDPDWASSYQALADDERPNMRYVTVREHRWAGQPGAQVDVDVVIHGNANDPDCGPLSRWAQTAKPGDRIGMLDRGPLFKIEHQERQVWLVGDETAVPAFAGILNSLPEHSTGRVVVEVPHEADQQELRGPKNMVVEWLPRGNGGHQPGDLAVARVRQLAAEVRPYVYGAGEKNLTTELKGLLVDESGWPEELVHTVFYWRIW